jgi:4-hydroxy-4-methyl-2-oxoglutarate aldolase
MANGKVRVPQAIVDEFKKIDAACVGDVVRGLGLNGIAEGLDPLSRDMKICGPAVTMRHIASRDNLNRARHEQVLVEMCKPGDVLVIDMGGRTDGGTWGGNITVEAMKRGLNGVVVDGGTRDIMQIIEAGFPTFVRGHTLKHTHGTFMSTCLNTEPVQIGTPPFSVPVAPGDIVIGNADGICIVPAERAEEILKLAQERHEGDLKMHKLLESGKKHGDPEVDAQVKVSRRLEGVKQADDYRW